MKPEKFIIITFGMLIVSLSLTIYLGYFLTTQPSHMEEIPCYDRYGHEIKEVTCEQKILDSPTLNFIYTTYNDLFPLLIIGHLFLLTISLFGILKIFYIK